MKVVDGVLGVRTAQAIAWGKPAGLSRARRSSPTSRALSATAGPTIPRSPVFLTTATGTRASAWPCRHSLFRSTRRCRRASMTAAPRTSAGLCMSAMPRWGSARRLRPMQPGPRRSSVNPSVCCSRRVTAALARTRVWMGQMRRRALLTDALSHSRGPIAEPCPRGDAVHAWPRLIVVVGARATTLALPSARTWSFTSALLVSLQIRILVPPRSAVLGLRCSAFETFNGVQIA